MTPSLVQLLSTLSRGAPVRGAVLPDGIHAADAGAPVNAGTGWEGEGEGPPGEVFDLLMEAAPADQTPAAPPESGKGAPWPPAGMPARLFIADLTMPEALPVQRPVPGLVTPDAPVPVEGGETVFPRSFMTDAPMMATPLVSRLASVTATGLRYGASVPLPAAPGIAPVAFDLPPSVTKGAMRVPAPDIAQAAPPPEGAITADPALSVPPRRERMVIAPEEAAPLVHDEAVPADIDVAMTDAGVPDSVVPDVAAGPDMAVSGGAEPDRAMAGDAAPDAAVSGVMQPVDAAPEAAVSGVTQPVDTARSNAAEAETVATDAPRSLPSEAPSVDGAPAPVRGVEASASPPAPPVTVQAPEAPAIQTPQTGASATAFAAIPAEQVRRAGDPHPTAPNAAASDTAAPAGTVQPLAPSDTLRPDTPRMESGAASAAPLPQRPVPSTGDGVSSPRPVAEAARPLDVSVPPASSPAPVEGPAPRAPVVSAEPNTGVPGPAPVRVESPVTVRSTDAGVPVDRAQAAVPEAGRNRASTMAASPDPAVPVKGTAPPSAAAIDTGPNATVHPAPSARPADPPASPAEARTTMLLSSGREGAGPPAMPSTATATQRSGPPARPEGGYSTAPMPSTPPPPATTDAGTLPPRAEEGTDIRRAPVDLARNTAAPVVEGRTAVPVDPPARAVVAGDAARVETPPPPAHRLSNDGSPAPRAEAPIAPAGVRPDAAPSREPAAAVPAPSITEVRAPAPAPEHRAPVQSAEYRAPAPLAEHRAPVSPAPVESRAAPRADAPVVPAQGHGTAARTESPPPAAPLPPADRVIVSRLPTAPEGAVMTAATQGARADAAPLQATTGHAAPVQATPPPAMPSSQGAPGAPRVVTAGEPVAPVASAPVVTGQAPPPAASQPMKDAAGAMAAVLSAPRDAGRPLPPPGVTAPVAASSHERGLARTMGEAPPPPRAEPAAPVTTSAPASSASSAMAVNSPPAPPVRDASAALIRPDVPPPPRDRTVPSHPSSPGQTTQAPAPQAPAAAPVAAPVMMAAAPPAPTTAPVTAASMAMVTPVMATGSGPAERAVVAEAMPDFAAAPVSSTPDAARADTAPAAPRPAPDGAALARQVAAAVPPAAPGRSSVELRLDPPELGRVEMDFTFEDDRLRVVIRADRDEAFDLLRRHGHELARELRAAGFDLESLRFGDRGTRDGDGQGRAGWGETARQDDEARHGNGPGRDGGKTAEGDAAPEKPVDTRFAALRMTGDGQLDLRF